MKNKYGSNIYLLQQMTSFLAHVDRIDKDNELKGDHSEGGGKFFWTHDQMHELYINNENICGWMFESFANRMGCSCLDLLQREAGGSGMDTLHDIPYHVVGLCVNRRYEALRWIADNIAHTHTAGTPSSSEAKELTSN